MSPWGLTDQFRRNDNPGRQVKEGEVAIKMPGQAEGSAGDQAGRQGQSRKKILAMGAPGPMNTLDGASSRPLPLPNRRQQPNTRSMTQSSAAYRTRSTPSFIAGSQNSGSRGDGIDEDDSSQGTSNRPSPRKKDEKIKATVAEFRAANSPESGGRQRRRRTKSNATEQASSGYSGINSFRQTLSGKAHIIIEDETATKRSNKISADELALDPPPANVQSDIVQPHQRGRKRAGAHFPPNTKREPDDDVDELLGSKSSNAHVNNTVPDKFKVLQAASSKYRYELDSIWLKRTAQDRNTWKAFDGQGKQLAADLFLIRGRIITIKFQQGSQFVFFDRPSGGRGGAQIHPHLVLKLVDARAVELLVKQLGSTSPRDNISEQRKEGILGRIFNHTWEKADPCPDPYGCATTENEASSWTRAAASLVKENGSFPETRKARLVDGLQNTQHVEEETTGKTRQWLGGMTSEGVMTITNPGVRGQKLAAPTTRGTRSSGAALFGLIDDTSPLRRSHPAPRVNRPRREPSPEPIRWTTTTNIDWRKHFKQPIVFPPTGRDRATVSEDDIPRLDEGEFLNDSIVLFGLRHAQLEAEKKNASLATQVYLMNTYFYEALKKDANHERIRKWTSKVDLLSFDYIIVPVNESTHWYLAIICNAKKCIPAEDERTPSVETLDVNEDSQMEEKRPAHFALVDGANTKSPPSLLALESEVPSSSLPTNNRKGAKKRMAPPRNPNDFLIITMDSLGGVHSATCRRLRDYIISEIEFRLNKEAVLPAQIGKTAKGIPTQPNYSDCGLYLISYFKHFMENPKQVVSTLAKGEETQWQFDSSNLRNELRDNLLEIACQKSTEDKASKRKRRDQNSKGSTVSTQPSPAKSHTASPTIGATSPSRHVQPSDPNDEGGAATGSSGNDVEKTRDQWPKELPAEKVPAVDPSSQTVGHASPAAASEAGTVEVINGDITMVDAPPVHDDGQGLSREPLEVTTSAEGPACQSGIPPTTGLISGEMMGQGDGMVGGDGVQDEDAMDLIQNHAAPDSDDQNTGSTTSSTGLLSNLGARTAADTISTHRVGAEDITTDSERETDIPKAALSVQQGIARNPQRDEPLPSIEGAGQTNSIQSPAVQPERIEVEKQITSPFFDQTLDGPQSPNKSATKNQEDQFVKLLSTETPTPGPQPDDRRSGGPATGVDGEPRFMSIITSSPRLPPDSPSGRDQRPDRKRQSEDERVQPGGQKRLKVSPAKTPVKSLAKSPAKSAAKAGSSKATRPTVDGGLQLQEDGMDMHFPRESMRRGPKQGRLRRSTEAPPMRNNEVIDLTADVDDGTTKGQEQVPVILG